MEVTMNRIEEEIKSWKVTEDRMKAMFGTALLKNRAFQMERLGNLESVITKHTNLSVEERIARNVLRENRNQLEKQLYPKRGNIMRLLFRAFRSMVNAYKSFENGSAEQVPYLQPIKQESGAYRESVVKAGFASQLGEVDQNIKAGKRKFEVLTTRQENEKENMDFRLQFNKGAGGEYEWGYKAILYSKDNPGEKREYVFSPVQTRTIDSAKAYDLLSGRAITEMPVTALSNQTGESKQVWKQLDFNDKDSTGNYRMKEFTGEYSFKAIREIYNRLELKEKESPKESARIIAALLNGKREPVTLIKDGREKQIYLEANPQANTLRVFDNKANEIKLRNVLSARVVPLDPKRQVEKQGKTNQKGISFG